MLPGGFDDAVIEKLEQQLIDLRLTEVVDAVTAVAQTHARLEKRKLG